MRGPPAKLLDRARHRIRLKGYSIRTEQSHVGWMRRFILFQNKRHPQDMEKDKSGGFIPNKPCCSSLKEKTRVHIPQKLRIVYLIQLQLNILRSQLASTNVHPDNESGLYCQS